MLETCKLFVVSVLLLLPLIHCQDQSGFISIDCGQPNNSSYREETTGLIYISDSSFIDSGESKSISSEYKDNYQQQLWYLRSFPQGIRNCYKISNIINGTKYLIRTEFLYGNYDGQDTLPEFDLHLGSNLWDTIKLKYTGISLIKEIIHVSLHNYLYICLVNTGFGTPFVSTIELRPLNMSYYQTKTPGYSLALVYRFDTGLIGNVGYRYPFDVHDRFWSPYARDSWTNISTPFKVDVVNDTFQLPSIVMSTAATPKSANDSLEFWLPTDSTDLYYVHMYFAEVEKLLPNQYREFLVSYNGYPLRVFSPIYLLATGLSSSSGVIGGAPFVFSRTANSTLPPLINGIEIYAVKEFLLPDTHERDADAITKLKSTYGVKRNWQGDPCTPKYIWEGLNCSYVNDSGPPRIISLNFSSSGLTGEIPFVISNLTVIEVLDLSDNNLTGPVPDFLSKLSNLKVLDLEKNNLSGSVPTELVQKWNEGSLELRVDQNPNLCVSASCEKKEKKKDAVVPVVASVAGTFILLLSVTAILWGIKRKRQHKDATDKKPDTQLGSFESIKRQFTWLEIVKITNNFERIIGEGGFGTVYHGCINDSQVAVKMLSPSSVQGYRQFHAEVNLLVRVHHKNITSLVGYCNDGTNTGLIYEYMANGNLKTHISDDSSSVLKWEDRLRIALEAAQGLEYLHDGCRPPIVHRDVKSTNILLNENFQAKLSDFGLSKIFPESNTHASTVVAGTPGYLDPEYYISNLLTEKSDVYSFGVVMMEIISSRPAIARTYEKTHISTWVNSMLAKGDIKSIVDSRLQGNFDTNSVWKAVEISMACVSPTSTKRPTMSHVVAELKECLAMERAHVGKNLETVPIQSVSMNSPSELSPLAR